MDHKRLEIIKQNFSTTLEARQMQGRTTSEILKWLKESREIWKRNGVMFEYLSGMIRAVIKTDLILFRLRNGKN